MLGLLAEPVRRKARSAHQPHRQGMSSQAGNLMGAEFAVQILPVFLDGLDRTVNPGSDLPVMHSQGDQFQDLYLTGGEMRSWRRGPIRLSLSLLRCRCILLNRA